MIRAATMSAFSRRRTSPSLHGCRTPSVDLVQALCNATASTRAMGSRGTGTASPLRSSAQGEESDRSKSTDSMLITLNFNVSDRLLQPARRLAFRTRAFRSVRRSPALVRRSSGSSLIAGPPRNREHQSTGREEHQCRGPAVTQQWQGDAGHGHDAHRHPMFSKQLKAKKTNTPMQMIRPIVSLARRPIRKSRNATKASSRMISSDPTKPNCSRWR